MTMAPLTYFAWTSATTRLPAGQPEHTDLRLGGGHIFSLRSHERMAAVTLRQFAQPEPL